MTEIRSGRSPEDELAEQRSAEVAANGVDRSGNTAWDKFIEMHPNALLDDPDNPFDSKIIADEAAMETFGEPAEVDTPTPVYEKRTEGDEGAEDLAATTAIEGDWGDFVETFPESNGDATTVVDVSKIKSDTQESGRKDKDAIRAATGQPGPLEIPRGEAPGEEDFADEEENHSAEA